MSKQSEHSRRKSSEAAEIGEIPPVLNPERREACRLDLFRFLQTYFPESTGLSPFSADHRRVIDRIQRCILDGGRFGNAVYRGFAKTTISENSAIWATAYGHRKCVPIFGADDEKATENIDSIQKEFEGNDLLLEDFPEICVPVRALEGKHQRCHSQTHRGELTKIRWNTDKLILPTIEGSKASGSVLFAKGLLGGSRGTKKKTARGENLRPDFVIVDDPQTDESAASPTQVKKRLKILTKNILKMAGHRKTLAIVVNLTIIEPGDMGDQLLDPVKFPSWQCERIPMIRAWSDAHDTLWVKYGDIRKSFDVDDVDDQRRAHAEATEFYRTNRAAMDAGCVVSWESCFDPDVELSAIQHAYNAFIDDGPEAFASEMQQQPIPERISDRIELTADEIAAKLSKVPEGIVPAELPTLTAYVDVQEEALFWLVLASGPGFSAAVVRYGVFPDQRANHFTYRGLRFPLSSFYDRNITLEARLHAALNHVVNDLAGRAWPMVGGGGAKISRILIDEGFQSPVIFQFCRQSPHARIVLPAKGFGIGAKRAPISEWVVRPGDMQGHHWRIGPGNVNRGIPHAIIDTNFWKNFIHARLAVPAGAPGSLTLFGDDAARHETIAGHMLAEYRTPVTANGRTVDEWDAYPAKPDNHWFDCVVGAAAAASMEGVSMEEWAPVKEERKLARFSDLQKSRRRA